MERWGIGWWEMPRQKQNQYNEGNKIGGNIFTTYRRSMGSMENNIFLLVYKHILLHCSTRSQTHPQESRLAGGEGLLWCRQPRQSPRGYWWMRAWKGSWWKVCQMMLDLALAAETTNNSLINSLCSPSLSLANEWWMNERTSGGCFYELSREDEYLQCRFVCFIATHTWWSRRFFYCQRAAASFHQCSSPQLRVSRSPFPTYWILGIVRILTIH